MLVVLNSNGLVSAAVGPRFWKPCLTAGAAQLNFIHTCHCQPKDVFDNWRINYVANPEAGREKAVLNETNTSHVHFRNYHACTTGLEACSRGFFWKAKSSQHYNP